MFAKQQIWVPPNVPFNHSHAGPRIYQWNNDNIMAPDVLALLTHLTLNKMAAILADDIFKCIFLNENVRISIKISLKCVPKGPIDNKSALVQVMAWG